MALLKKQDKQSQLQSQPQQQQQKQQQQQHKLPPKTTTIQLRTTPHHLNVSSQVKQKKLPKSK